MGSVFQDAILYFGAREQLFKLQEEAGELVQAVNKVRRKEWLPERLIEEVADMEIMIAQARIILGSARVDGFKKQKITRLAQMIGSKSLEVPPSESGESHECSCLNERGEGA